MHLSWHTAVLLMQQRGEQLQTAAKCLTATKIQVDLKLSVLQHRLHRREMYAALTPSRKTLKGDIGIQFLCRNETQT